MLEENKNNYIAHFVRAEKFSTNRENGLASDNCKTHLK